MARLSLLLHISCAAAVVFCAFQSCNQFSSVGLALFILY